MDFEFTIVGRVTALTDADARLQVAKAVRQLDNYKPDPTTLFTDVGYDVKQYPRGGPTGEHEMAQGGRLIDIIGPEPTIPHPWEQGLYIFPDDHPLRAAEEFARARYNQRPGLPAAEAEKEKWGELGQLELVEGDGHD